MAGVVKVLVQLEDDLVLPIDRTVNTFHFAYPGGAPVNLAALKDALVAFYNALDPYLAENLNGDGTIRMYDLADPEPRTPIAGYAFTIVAGTSNLPGEVALCMSYAAVAESGQPQARRRGRVFIGPLADDALASATGRPDTGFINALRGAGRDLLAWSDGSADWAWIVWSPTDNIGRFVTNGWVDNEWDTMRSRGKRADNRGTFTASTP